jgi:hypothetical protein
MMFPLPLSDPRTLLSSSNVCSCRRMRSRQSLHIAQITDIQSSFSGVYLCSAWVFAEHPVKGRPRRDQWIYNGRVRGSLWYTISARSTRLGRSTNPWPSKTFVKPPAMQETGLSISPRSGKALYKISFSTVSLGC